MPGSKNSWGFSQFTDYIYSNLFFFKHISVLERFPSILGYSLAPVPCALPISLGGLPWWKGLPVAAGLPGRGRSRTTRTFLPSTDPWLCNSALTIYTELASGGPSWDQDPAVPATDRSWRLSSLQRACAVSREAILWGSKVLLLSL